jgi:hypothetical protein
LFLLDLNEEVKNNDKQEAKDKVSEAKEDVNGKSAINYNKRKAAMIEAAGKVFVCLCWTTLALGFGNPAMGILLFETIFTAFAKLYYHNKISQQKGPESVVKLSS